MTATSTQQPLQTESPLLSIPVEAFIPTLVIGHQLIELPDGAAAIVLGERHFRVEPFLAPTLKFFGRGLSLCEIVSRLGANKTYIPIHRFLKLIYGLSREGWLGNSSQELINHGLPIQDHAVKQFFLLKALSIAQSAKTIPLSIMGRLTHYCSLPLRPLMPKRATLLALVSVSTLFLLVFKSPIDRFPGAKNLLSPDFWILALIAGMFFASFTRYLFRSALLAYYQTADDPPLQSGISLLMGFIPLPWINEKGLFRKGINAEINLHLAGATGSLVAAASLQAFTQYLEYTTLLNGPTAILLALASVGTIFSALVSLNPFGFSDLSFLLHHGLTLSQKPAPSEPTKGQLDRHSTREHTLSYMHKQIIRGQGIHPLFIGESHHIAMTCALAAWVYLLFRSGLELFLLDLLPSTMLLLNEAFLEGHWIAQISSLTILLIALLMVLCAISLLLIFTYKTLRFQLSSLVHKITTTQHPLAQLDSKTIAERLHNVALFGHLGPQHLALLSQSAQPVRVAANIPVVRQGDSGESFFIIIEGDATVEYRAESGIEMTVATLHEGDGFGEIALLERCPRTATVRAITPLLLLKIDRQHFIEALEKGGVKPSHATALLRGLHALRSLDLFTHLASSSLLRLLESCERKTIKHNTQIITEGEIGRQFYIIESGSVEVLKDGNPVATLSDGQCFGEIALITDEPRNASVVSKSDCSLLALDKATFRTVLAHDFAAAQRVEELAIKRSK